jgi:hypothetical protein
LFLLERITDKIQFLKRYVLSDRYFAKKQKKMSLSLEPDWQLFLAWIFQGKLEFWVDQTYVSLIVCFSYFSGRVLHSPPSHLDPPTYRLLHSWDHRCMPHCLAFWLIRGLTNFSPWAGLEL